jgi:hypothetical protein
MAATAAIVTGVGTLISSGVGAIGQVKSNKRMLRKQDLALAEQKRETEELLAAERTAADQAARNLAASRQRRLLAEGKSQSVGKSGTLLTGARGLASKSLLGG